VRAFSCNNNHQEKNGNNRKEKNSHIKHSMNLTTKSENLSSTEEGPAVQEIPTGHFRGQKD
jgi:hypothetical protein